MRPLLLFGSLLYTLFLTAPVTANPVFPDEQSLLRGSDVYVRHCAECHGWTIVERYRERDFEDAVDGYAPELDYEALVNEVHGIEEVDPEDLVYIEDEEEEWPEWAQFPDPDEDVDARRERVQTIEEITAVIDDVYYADMDALDVEEAADGETESEGFDVNGPIGGATELQNPYAFLFGISEQDIYNSIAQGNGAEMPAFLDSLGSEEAIWDLVNFIRSFWPDEETAY